MRIPKTGTYVDGNGNAFWFREGEDAPDGLAPQPEVSKQHGAPENRAEPRHESREKGPEKAAEPRGKGQR
jgi:hypothetical protein